MKTIFDVAVKLETKCITHEMCKKDRTIYIPNIQNCKMIVKETADPNIFHVEYFDNWKMNIPYIEVVPQIEDIYKDFWAVKTDTQEKIVSILDSMKDLLLYKNKMYGDSALNPEPIFYKGSSTDSILIRLNDKIGRIKNNKNPIPRTNDVADVIGYCTLLMISMGVTPEDIAKFKD